MVCLLRSMKSTRSPGGTSETSLVTSAGSRTFVNVTKAASHHCSTNLTPFAHPCHIKTQVQKGFLLHGACCIIWYCTCIIWPSSPSQLAFFDQLQCFYFTRSTLLSHLVFQRISSSKRLSHLPRGRPKFSLKWVISG